MINLKEYKKINLKEYKKDFFKEDFFNEDEQMYGDVESNVLTDFCNSIDSDCACENQAYLDYTKNLTKLQDPGACFDSACLSDNDDDEEDELYDGKDELDYNQYDTYVPQTVDLDVVNQFGNDSDEVSIIDAEHNADDYLNSLNNVLNRL